MTHFGKLERQQSYTGHFQLTVPSFWLSGEYNIFVKTNLRQRLFENGEYGNNMKSQKFTVQQLVPNLKVGEVSITLPDSSSPETERFNKDGNPIIQIGNITVTNIGKMRVGLNSPWKDTLFVECVESGYRAKIGEQEMSRLLEIGKSYTFIGYNTSVARQKPTDCHLVFYADSDEAIIESDKKNNRRESATFPLPVAVDEVQITMGIINSNGGGKAAEIYSGNKYSIDVSYTVKGSYPTSGSFKDSLELDLEDKVYQLEQWSINVMSSSTTYEKKIKFYLPDNIFGQAVLVLKHDIENSLIQGSSDQSRRVFKKEINLQYPPTPDLVPTEISFTLVDKERRRFSVTWQVTNEGNSMNSAVSWSDSLYLVNNKGNFILLTNCVTTPMLLKSGQIYSNTKDVYLSNEIVGSYRGHVVTDSRDQIFEGLIGEKNNQLSTSNERDIPELVLEKPKLPDLVVEILPSSGNYDGLTSGSQIVAGNEFSLSFRFLNNGTADLEKSSLFYTVHLKGILLKEVDSQLYSTVIYQSVGIGLAITKNLRFTVPITVPPGLYRVQIELDANRRINEMTKKNNMANTDPFQVTEIPSSDIDLQPEVSNITFVGGAPIKIPFQFTNQGPGNLTMLTPSYVTLILSTDQVVDPFDIRLCGLPVIIDLKVNKTYRGDIQCELPFDLPLERYFLILHVRGRTISKMDEEVQQFTNVVTMTNKIQRLRTDLAVLNIINTQHNMVAFGGQLRANWQVLNNGSSDIEQMYRCDTVYLSTDPKWDINDHEVDKRCQMDTNVKAGQSMQNTIDHAKVPLVRQAPFFFIVKTRSSLQELNNANNIGTSNATIIIQHQNLTLGTEQTVTVDGSRGVILRISKVPPGNSLMITAKAGDSSQFLEMFVNSGDIATSIDYVVYSGQQTSAHQSVSVPNTRNTDYYVLVRNSIDEKLIPNVKLLAKIAVFEITTVSPRRIPALFGAHVTLQIKGSLFPPKCMVTLRHKQSKMTAVNASNVYRFSSTEVFATFSMDSVNEGEDLYVEIQDTEELSMVATTSSDDAITVVAGHQSRGSGIIATHTNHQRAVRVNENIDVQLVVSNEGGVDALPPLFYMNITGNVEIHSLIENRRVLGSGGNFLFLASPPSQTGELSGILRPKQIVKFDFEIVRMGELVQESIPLYIQRFDKAPPETPNPYLSLKEALKPAHMSNRRWDPVWKQFIRNTGTTMDSFHKRICKTASHFSIIGRTAIDVDNLVRYEIALADGLYLSNNLHANIDLSVDATNTDTFLPITMRRYINPLLSFRDLPGPYNGHGPFGKLWIAPSYW